MELPADAPVGTQLHPFPLPARSDESDDRGAGERGVDRDDTVRRVEPIDRIPEASEESETGKEEPEYTLEEPVAQRDILYSTPLEISIALPAGRRGTITLEDKFTNLIRLENELPRGYVYLVRFNPEVPHKIKQYGILYVSEHAIPAPVPAELRAIQEVMWLVDLVRQIERWIRVAGRLWSPFRL